VSINDPDDSVANLAIGAEGEPLLSGSTVTWVRLIGQAQVRAQHINAGLPVLPLARRHDQPSCWRAPLAWTVMPEPAPRIVREVFADAEGRPVGRDDPAVAGIEVTVEHPDGRIERTYAAVHWTWPVHCPPPEHRWVSPGTPAARPGVVGERIRV
jgi:hypothetical protein